MKTNRRSFLVASGLTALAAGRAAAASDTIQLGAIGCGGRMRNILDSADRNGGFALVAGCDVYEPRREEIRTRSGDLASTYLDYHELLDKKDIDAVAIAAPDHWHVRIACDALAAGKDVYLEKPVTHTMEEGETLIKAVRASKHVVQCGMQQRSWAHFADAVNLMQSGSIGRITRVRTFGYQNYQGRPPAKHIDAQLLDWKRWLGGTPEQSFDEEKYRHWRWFWNFGGGAFTDLFTHWIDVAQWAMKSDAPKLVQAMGDKYFFDTWDCPDTVQAILRYDNFEVSYEGTMVSSIDDGGLEFRGTHGTLKLDRGGFAIYREQVKGENPVLKERSVEDGTIAHVGNFFDCVRSRKEPNAPVETGVAAARAGHLANLAMRKGEKVVWPQKV
jgi:predicted dehydrogenase